MDPGIRVSYVAKEKAKKSPHRYNPRLDVRDFGICMIDGIISDDSKSTTYDNLDSPPSQEEGSGSLSPTLFYTNFM